MADHLPYFLVGDEIFPVQNWLMRPYAGKALTNETRKKMNYLLSRARRIIENIFGILAAWWRVLLSPIDSIPEKVEHIVLATIALHNYLIQTDTAVYTPSGFIDSESNTGEIKKGQWREIVENSRGNLIDVNPTHTRRHTNSAIETRDTLAEYFITDVGSVPWKWDYIRRTVLDT